MFAPAYADRPVMRHYSSAFKFYGAVPGAQLVVRMISTVYNYDYIQDLMLNVDGSIDVRVTTSGYVQAGPFRSFYPQNFGFPLFTNVSGGAATRLHMSTACCVHCAAASFSGSTVHACMACRCRIHAVER